MHDREELWNRWLGLECKLKSLKGVIQNEIEMDQDSLIEWLKETIEFEAEYDQLVRDRQEDRVPFV